MSNDGEQSFIKPVKSAKKNVANISRRGLFQRIAVAAGGVAMVLAKTAPAEAKMTQKAAGYQDAPKGDQSCSNCGLFSAPASCSLVDGTINPQGWCRFHQNKS